MVMMQNSVQRLVRLATGYLQASPMASPTTAEVVYDALDCNGFRFRSTGFSARQSGRAHEMDILTILTPLSFPLFRGSCHVVRAPPRFGRQVLSAYMYCANREASSQQHLLSVLSRTVMCIRQV